MASLNQILPSCSGSIHHQQYICWWSSRRIPLWQDAQGSATVTDCWLPPPDAPTKIPGFCAENQKAGYMSALAISFFNFVSISGHTARKPQKTQIIIWRPQTFLPFLNGNEPILKTELSQNHWALQSHNFPWSTGCYGCMPPIMQTANRQIIKFTPSP